MAAAGALGDTPLASNQPRYSLLYRQVEREIFPMRENNVGIIVYSPMAMGILTGRVTMDRTFLKAMGGQKSALPPGQQKASD